MCMDDLSIITIYSHNTLYTHSNNSFSSLLFYIFLLSCYSFLNMSSFLFFLFIQILLFTSVSLLFLFLDDLSVSVSSSLSSFSSSSPAPDIVDCMKASELCNLSPQCSSRYRIMRQCLVGKDWNSMLASKECQEALEFLQSMPLVECRCKRGMKKEITCLQNYWLIYMGLSEGTVHARSLANFLLRRNTLFFFFPFSH